ncbi:MAG: N-acetylmuramoyl-L-alanine amidase [Ruminococcus sp.]|nr:N-acetylmuramoyl-L-alanine amidase [Ruminococcus sp.]
MRFKKIYLITISLFLIYIFLVFVAFFNLERYTDANSNVINNDVTVVIDAGHGGEDGGAVANDITEKDINLSIANKLADVFKTAGYKVVMTRSEDEMVNAEGETLRNRKVSDMHNRLDIFNENESNVVISIHQNKFTQEQYHGTQIFYSANNEKSLSLATAIRDDVRLLIQPDNTRECKPAGTEIFLLNNTNVPAVIVECGFISNYEESRKLNTEEYQDKIVFAIFAGFMDYINN